LRKKTPPLPPPARPARRENRVSEEDKVVLELLTNGRPVADATTINALTRDISPGGVRIMSRVSLPVGTLLRLEIALGQSRKLINPTGIVRWVRSVSEPDLFELGIEFKNISAEDKVCLLEHTYRKRL
jgi:c-di-GMP-binding flagellar brake protein YcgR